MLSKQLRGIGRRLKQLFGPERRGSAPCQELGAGPLPPQADLNMQAVTEARARLLPLGLITIDADEPCTCLHPAGIEVRGWDLVPYLELEGRGIPAHDLIALVCGLPAATRDILALSQSGKNAREIAKILGITRRAVRRHLRRAVRMIARAQTRN